RQMHDRRAMPAQHASVIPGITVEQLNLVFLAYRGQEFAVRSYSGNSRGAGPVRPGSGRKDTGQGGGPQAYRFVGSRSRNLPSRWRKGNSLYGVRMAFLKIGQLAARRGFPEAQGFVGTDAGHNLAARRESDSCHRIGVPFEAAFFL